MLDFLNRAVTVDTYTLVVVAMLSGWAGVLTLHVLSRTVLALVFVPGFILGALVTNYVFELTGFYPTPDRETNVVIACTSGIVMALLASHRALVEAGDLERRIVALEEKEKIR